MATVSDILAKKGTHVEVTGPQATAFEAAKQMTECKIGCLVVIENDNVCGIVSERDMLKRVVAEKCDPAATPVRDIMTSEVRCCRPGTDIGEARYVMMDRRIRHIPVVDDNEKLMGIISIGDLNAIEAHSKEQTIHLLHEYIYGHSMEHVGS